MKASKQVKSQNMGNMTDANSQYHKPELSLRQDPNNPLQLYRRQVDLDVDFFKKMMIIIDPFDAQKSEQEYNQYRTYCKIMMDKPTLFQEQHKQELTREEKRIQTHRQLVYYFEKCGQVSIMRDVLNDVEKCLLFLSPINVVSMDVTTKLFVSCQLAYKTIENLGTNQHQIWKERMEQGLDRSCFALTELGHGSNVKGILTTATYDQEAKEFIINSPSKEAMKFWIGGAGKTSNTCVMFAQLFVNGENHGPHAFIVPLRDRKSHMALPGITLGDCGMKEGLEGIDNGFIMFDNVRIPKGNFLNRLSDISFDGVFSSPIENSDQRFALSLGGLSTGRIILIQNMINYLHVGLKIAIRFSAMRRQFGDPKSNQETQLLEYSLQQYRLFPYLAGSWSLGNMCVFIKKQWTLNQKKIFKPGNFKLAELHALISSIKAISSWYSFSGLQQCRLCCGGLGYSFYSFFGQAMAGVDINCTWEGDNNVLLQQTAKFLLDQYKKKMQNKAKQSITVEWIKIDDVTEDKCEAHSIEEFMTHSNLKQVFEYRCNKLLQRSVMSLGQKMMDKSKNKFDAWNEEQVFGAQELALAYGECAMLQIDIAFLKSMDSCEKKQFMTFKKDTKDIIDIMFKLNTLMKIQKDIAIWYEHSYLDADQGEFIRSEIKRLLHAMKKYAVSVVDCLNPDDDVSQIMIAPQDGNLYGNITRQLYSSPGTFERISNWEELVQGAKL